MWIVTTFVEFTRDSTRADSPVILIIDNYDSFTWNLAQYLGELNAEPRVVRNDQITSRDALAQSPTAIIISPGPCTPNEAGISVDLIRAAALAKVPTLGVCLGHQAAAQAFGGTVVRAGKQMHGKVSAIEHVGTGLFLGMENPMPVMRYHSLIVAPQDFPDQLEITAWSSDRPKAEEIMAIRHRTAPLWGVQFHPESIGTPAGKRLLQNFLSQLQEVG